MFSSQPHRRPNGIPTISTIGEPVAIVDIPYIRLAADGLNYRDAADTYVVDQPNAAGFSPNGQRLPSTHQMVQICGMWALDPNRDLSELLSRAADIKADFSDSCKA